jgi:hypothetical protein
MQSERVKNNLTLGFEIMANKNLFHEYHFDGAEVGEFSVSICLEGAKSFFPQTILCVEADGYRDMIRKGSVY